MADFFDPIRLPPPEFEALIQRVDRAFRVGAATLVGSVFGTPEVDVFDPRTAGFSDEEWERLQPVVQNLDQIIEFAYDDAPHRDVAEWVASYVTDPDEAQLLMQRTLDCLDVLRKRGENIFRTWRAKIRSILPILGPPRSRLVRGVSSGQVELQFVLTASTARPGPIAVPVQEFVVQLLPSDIAMLQHLLAKAAEELAAAHGQGTA